MFTVLLLSVAMSVDAVGLGISFGVRKIKMGFSAAVIISLTGFFIITLAMLTGTGIQYLLSENTGSLISSLILIGMGLWVIVQSCEKPDSTGSRTVKIVRSPQEGDLDKSGNIDKTEAFFLGLALSLDSVGICIGAGSMHLSFILPPAAMVMQMLFIVLGIWLGGIIGRKINTQICTLLSGSLIILIGVYNLV